MEYIRKFKDYDGYLLNENNIYELGILKNMTYIKNNIKNINIGKNTFFFDFDYSNDKFFDPFKVSFYVNIQYIKNNHKIYESYVNEQQLRTNNFRNFDLNVSIEDDIIDYQKLYGIILHELKHVYDLYNNINQTSFNKVIHNNGLISYYKNNKWIVDFLNINYLAFSHEVDARLRMIYDKLSYLKIYDKEILEKEFEKTYMYKSGLMIKNFDSNNIINNTDFKTLLQFTNDFIFNVLKQNKILKNKNDLYTFYLNIENKFHDIADKFFIEANKIIDELILDIKPYMEKNSLNPFFNQRDEKWFLDILKSIYE